MTSLDIPAQTRASLSALTFTAVAMEASTSTVIASFSTSPSHRLPSEDLRCDIPTKRLRSCLSPTRARRCDEGFPPSQGIDSAGPSPMASRSTSFSSADSSTSSAWRRKQVRWQGEEAGCEVASYHATWSASEYDRTPLDPPSEGERACIMPERNSRCLSPLEFFSDSGRGRAPWLEKDEDEDGDADEDDSPRSLQSIILATPPCEEGDESGSDVGGGAGAAAGPDEEDREWEECMERRRMMFAQMAARRHNPAGDASPCGGLDGYTSLSATLAELLRSVGCQDGSAGPAGPGTPQVDEDEDDGAATDEEGRSSEGGDNTPVLPKRPIGPSGLRMEYRASLEFGRTRRISDEDEDEEFSEDEDEEAPRRFSSPLETPELEGCEASSSDLEDTLTPPLDFYPTSALQICLQT